MTDEQRSSRPIFNATPPGRGQLAVFLTSRLPVLTSCRLPLKIREANEIGSQNLYESRWPAAMLHVRPAGLAYGRHVETIARGNETGFVTRERVGLRCILDHLVFPEVFVLGLSAIVSKSGALKAPRLYKGCLATR